MHDSWAKTFQESDVCIVIACAQKGRPNDPATPQTPTRDQAGNQFGWAAGRSSQQAPQRAAIE
jgi:hypothetical protein